MSCGAFIPFHVRESRGTRLGAACRSRNAFTSGLGLSAPMIPSSTSSIGALRCQRPRPRFCAAPGTARMLYSNSTVALDPETGKLVWYFQHLPRDNWDLDHPFERVLVDVEVEPDKDATWVSNPNVAAGEKRKVLTGIPGKNGIVWTLDRETGEFLWARETVYQNVVDRIDAVTGKVSGNLEVIPQNIEDSYGLVCPGANGGRNGPPRPIARRPVCSMRHFRTCVWSRLSRPLTRSLRTGTPSPCPEGLRRRRRRSGASRRSRLARAGLPGYSRSGRACSRPSRPAVVWSSPATPIAGSERSTPRMATSFGR